MRLRSKRGVILIVAVVFLALFLVRPGASRLRTRIANSIGMALQRQVDISRVHLRLLPQPGFELDGFVVHDDPAFGAEPVLRAQEVTALLRFTSLLHGRLEISRLSLSEPSLNLVRRSDGHWNIESLLERSASISTAPTSKARSESRVGFPYIEAERGRINLKLGPEKKPFSLTDAKYSLWQDTENEWGMRLKGQPVRTDFNLSDTGQINIDGRWRRAASLQETPLKFNLQWDEAQLGQLTKLVSGRDRGWRGTLHVALALEGEPVDLQVHAETSLDDFRRYDITDSRALELKSRCDAHYSTSEHSLRDIFCTNPVGDGTIALTGDAINLLGQRQVDLQFAADNVPVNAVLAVVRRSKKNLPDDLRATGTLNARVSAHADASTPFSVEGSGETNNFHLLSTSMKTDVLVDVLPFALSSSDQNGLDRKGHARRGPPPPHEPDGPRLLIGPVPLRLGRPTSMMVQGWMARSGYSLSIKGESELQRLLALARISGIPAGHPNATGVARVDLQIAGPWQGFNVPQAIGTAELHGVRAEVRGLNRPLEIASARLVLADSTTRVEALSASFAGSQWTGAMSIPRPCAQPASCTLSFDLHTDEISIDRLSEWLDPNASRPWYRFGLSPPTGSSLLMAIHASGTLAANRVVIRDVTAYRIGMKLALDQGKLHLSDVNGEVLGGEHHGEWRADFTAKPPTYAGSGTMSGVSLEEVASAMHDNWIAGVGGARYQLEMEGTSASDLVNSAKGSLHFDMRDGTLPHVMVAAAPLRVHRFTGVLSAKDGEFQLQDASLESPTLVYAVSGSASLNRKLDFKLQPEGSAGFTVTGTLAEPRVAPLRRPETQAALKP